MLRYAEKSDIGKWPEMTSPVEHSQCLLFNFNIFNERKYDFILLMFLCIFYIDDMFSR